MERTAVMTATILTIGDELLIGQIVDSNSAWIGEQLTRLGVSVQRKVTVGDEPRAIGKAVREAFESTHIVICTGGLGPTDDDRTTEAVAAEFGVPLVEDTETLGRIRTRFEKRGLQMAESNRKQALIPQGFEPLMNSIGTAPGLVYRDGDRLLALLPGVPREMKSFMREDLLPRIARMEGLPAIRQVTLHTTGIAESELHEQIGELEESDGISIAWLPSTTGVRMRLTAFHADPDLAESRLERAVAFIRKKAGDYLFGEGDDTLEGVLGSMLRDRGLTIAVAESCTGGTVAGRITDIPGSSDYMLGGAVTYSNASKVAVLGVSESDLVEYGAVSRQVAVRMAAGVRERFGASVGLSTTGIMGPGGGSDEKPVGTVWVGFADENGASAVLLRLGPHRATNRERAATAALNLVRKRLLKTTTG